MGLFYNRAAMTVSGAPGTGAVTLGTAFTAHQTFADAGILNGQTIAYVIEDGTNWEIGRGTYSSTGPTLTRSTILWSSSGGSAINATSSAVVFVSFIAENVPDTSGGASFAGALESGANGGTLGSLKLYGSTSGDVTLRPNAVAGTAVTLTLPAGSGTLARTTDVPAAAGSSGQIQYNNAGAFGGMSGTSWDDTNRSLTITGATVATSQPLLNLAQTWNAGAVTFSGLKFNVTDTASAAGSLLLDLQVGGAAQFNVNKSGVVATVGHINAPTLNANAGSGVGNNYVRLANATLGIELGSSSPIQWYPNAPISGSADLFIRRAAAATLQLGSSDAAAPVAQSLQVQSVVAGTSNTAGANFTINGSRGTGTGAGGSIILRVAPAGTSGSSQNAYSTALTINSTGLATFSSAVTTISTTFASLPSAATAGSGARAFITDATATTFLSVAAGGGANKVPVVSDGTNWLIG